ncbi:hypothetical protein M9H77_28839 [Catharanthus roseus]|uniref:Uncharacterized protein n=1 Tax=Catharanthus roseus TaxID=4058 RepID=A0ACC0AKM1_CATRO|nr:hypothetical protein M9H77_28839 [Catharanthus roseus]
MHLKFSLTRDDEFVLIKRFLNDDTTHQTLLSLHISDESLSVLVSDLEIQSFIDETPYYHVPKLMGSCNGIICLFYYDNFILFNPATRQIRIIPPHPPCPEDFFRIRACWGFGFDTATNDYKIVIISRLEIENPLDDIDIEILNHDLNLNEARIYSLRMDSWKELDYVPPIIHSFRPRGFDLFFNNRIHWTEWAPYILSLDISTEVFHKFGYPKANKTSSDKRDFESLTVINDTFTLISYDSYGSSNPPFFEQFIDVWIMKEYGNEESWSKQYSIGPFTGISRPISIWKNNRIFLEKVVGGYLDRDELVQLAACDLFNCEQLLIYNNIHGKCEFSMEVVFYKETLVSIARN